MTSDANSDGTCACECAPEASEKVAQLNVKTRELTGTANGFARAMTSAFTASVVGGKQLDDVLKSLGMKLSELAVKAAFKPLEQSLSKSIGGLFSGLFGGGNANSTGGVLPFASGGVIGSPSYFPMLGGGVGLAGEAGPEAILPLARGPDGTLGVAGGGGATTVNIQIATPDADSFRRSESYLTGQIARAVARGQRGL